MGNEVSNYLKFDPNLQDLLKRKKIDTLTSFPETV